MLEEQLDEGGACVWYLDVLEHVRVVADLSQLHDRVHEGLCATFALEEKGNFFYCHVPMLPKKCKALSIPHTFLSFSEPSVSRTPLACMCLYRTLCKADMSHLITYSTWKKKGKDIRRAGRLISYSFSNSII